MTTRNELKAIRLNISLTVFLFGVVMSFFAGMKIGTQPAPLSEPPSQIIATDPAGCRFLVEKGVEQEAEIDVETWELLPVIEGTRCGLRR